ncbi:MAG: hypothetical protein FVQ84_00575 [Planctomycetes bacterium]|nr:hypothetical protein [Planctomycetota bacterium]
MLRGNISPIFIRPCDLRDSRASYYGMVLFRSGFKTAFVARTGEKSPSQGGGSKKLARRGLLHVENILARQHMHRILQPDAIE